MKTITMINSHWNNHGDEAAIRATVDELRSNGIKVNLQIIAGKVFNYPYEESEVELLQEYPRRRNVPEFIVGMLTKGRVVFTKTGKHYFSTLRNSDMVLHAPGGPSIGDIYKRGEYLYILKFLNLIRMGIPYAFYAPSAGPFRSRHRNVVRKAIYNHALFVSFREELTKNIGVDNI